MEIHIHIHHHYDDKLFTEIKSINTKISKMGQELDNLAAKVAEDTTVTQSAITLLNGLKQRLDDALSNQDWSKVQTLADDIGANNNALAAAVTANTPAATEPGTGEPGGETPTL